MRNNLAQVTSSAIGVSIIICCHNSAQRLPQALAQLAAQQVGKRILWEVIVVDNASTDGTSRVALNCWPAEAPASIRVVHEPRLGLSHARVRGFMAAQYELVSFIDDDNWACIEWVQTVSEIMHEHPEVGACGGFIEAVCEVDPPPWFARHKGSYVIGPQGRSGGENTNTRGWLCGAGLTIRKSAWEQLVIKGFCPLLVGREGTTLTAGEDVELCFALRLAGWSLWYEPRLKLRHFLPVHRLKWTYLCLLHRGFGAQGVGLDPYRFALNCKPKNLRERLEQFWQWKALFALLSLRYFPVTLLRMLLRRSRSEGDARVLDVECRLGLLFELLRVRGVYNQRVREIQNAPWRQVTTDMYAPATDKARHDIPSLNGE